MTVQQAAFNILTEIGRPLSAKELARLILERGSVSSTAKNPVLSIAGTIEKTIREEAYNSPRLLFVETTEGRRVGLPSMQSDAVGERIEGEERPCTVSAKRRVSVDLPQELVDRVELASQARLAANYDETVALLIQKGLAISKLEIRERILQRLDDMGAPFDPKPVLGIGY